MSASLRERLTALAHEYADNPHSPDLHETIFAAARLALEDARQCVMDTPAKFGTLADDSHKECAWVAQTCLRARASELVP